MVDIANDVEVRASVSEVWSVLADPARWPEWTPSVDSVDMLDGKLGPGLRVRIAQPGLRPMVWTVSRYEPGSVLTWTATAGGVTTTGSHEVLPAADGTSRLRLGLTQRGALAPLVGLLLGGRIRRYVQWEAAGLRAAAEARARSADEAS